MAITGLFLCLFLFFHLIDNLMIYRGKEAFEGHVKFLHSFPVFVSFFEILLVFFSLLHVFFGIYLFYQNQKARPVRYSVRRSAGGKTLSSTLMPYTGLYILFFVIVHLINFRFSIKEESLYELLRTSFSNPLYVLYYVFTMIVVALHVRHGFWSAFQTLGLNHPKYMPFIEKAGIAFAIILTLCLGSIPLYFYF